MKRKSALVLALVLVLTVAALFLLAPGPAMPARKKIPLPDGNIVTVEKVTFSFGTQHDFSFDDSTLARFARKLPRFLRRYFPSQGRMSWNTASNSLVLWFTMVDGKTGAPLDFHGLLAAEVVDEHGCSSAAQSYGSMKSGTNPSIYPTTFTQFPRRQAAFRVRLQSRTASNVDRNKPVAEFEVPNPVRGPFPVWEPEPLPAARTNADLVFVLKNAGNPVPGPDWSRPLIDILRGGLPARDWERDALYVTEATGNRGQSPFCTNEAAWKLEVEFLRNVKAAFLPTEMFTVTNLTVPAGGVAVLLTNTFSLQGKQLEMRALAGSGHFVYSNTVVTIAEPPVAGQGESIHTSTTYQGATPIHRLDVRRAEPHVALVVPPLAAGERLLVRARSVDGVAQRLLPGPSSTGMRHKLVPGPSSGGLSLFTLSGFTNAEPFDLDVIVHRPRRAEFLVKPPGK